MLEWLQLQAILEQCVVSGVEPRLMSAVARVESAWNPYAIGVVGGRLLRQPKNRLEAVATANALRSGGWNYSLGISQVNVKNFQSRGLTHETAFDACANLKAGSWILKDCLDGARALFGADRATPYALSCYYSGNWNRGLKPDAPDGSSYVQRVLSVLDGEDSTNRERADSPAAIPVIQTKPPAKRRVADRGADSYGYLDEAPMMYEAGSSMVK